MRSVVLGATGNGGTALLERLHRAATDWRPRTDARGAVRLVLDHRDGREGLGNAGHRSHSPLE